MTRNGRGGNTSDPSRIRRLGRIPIEISCLSSSLSFCLSLLLSFSLSLSRRGATCSLDSAATDDTIRRPARSPISRSRCVQIRDNVKSRIMLCERVVFCTLLSHPRHRDTRSRVAHVSERTSSGATTTMMTTTTATTTETPMGDAIDSNTLLRLYVIFSVRVPVSKVAAFRQACLRLGRDSALEELSHPSHPRT